LNILINNSDNKKGILFCFGFLFFTKSIIRAFLTPESTTLIFVNSADEAISKGFDPSRDQIVCWGQRGDEQSKILAHKYSSNVWKVEDGFIRSTGLGSDYTPPLSLVVDKTGIYYDPTHSSDLEIILQNHAFDSKLLTRAKNIQQQILLHSISKYNLGSSHDNFFKDIPVGKHIILVPGQVENDATIKKRCIDIQNNLDLLKTVRESNLNSFIIYKPHPDVVSGNRPGNISKKIVVKYCDLVVNDASINDCLKVADAVHTLTSLVGFEALLHNCDVHCYGIPFYSGWGITIDRHTISRRTRLLTLNELIAGTYILYPRYVDWKTVSLTTPESAIEILHQKIKKERGKQISQITWLHRKLRKLYNIFLSLFNIHNH
jgi:capsular polysaccharide export protein